MQAGCPTGEEPIAPEFKSKEQQQMSVSKAVTTSVFCLALMGVVLSPGAKADQWNQKTTLTFSGPVEIPGVHLKGWGVLPAGTYVFKLLDSQSDRHIVQIFNKDETVVVATILAISNYRLKTTGKTVVTFRERPAGEPEALRAWFFPGENYGQEFVYPKARAMELAKESKTVVLFTAAEIPMEVAEPIKTADEPVVVQLKQAPVMAVQPTGEEVELAQAVAPPAEEPVAENAAPAAEMPATLPATGSTLPLIALLGLLALGGALVLRQAQKRAL
jgi:LPXTG-motif cell wall-anchored protein